ncbi:MAG: S-layer homology domain-containing protein [Clostridia bacterium]|nr:S-layer homology domain-containing protein [Clostridia bacterium]
MYLKGLMTGTAEDKFSPNMNLTRAQMVQLLFNMSGESKSDYMGKSRFDDVDALAWYAPAVNWADENEITSGVSESKFAPNKVITRQELARFLYTYASSTKKYIIYHREDLSRFSDQDKVADWAYDNLSWAVGAGIISGMTEDTLAPRDTATRPQAARMLMMYDKYLSDNVKVTTGAFITLADYITEKGKYGGGYWPNTYVYRIVSGEKIYTAEYDPSSDAIRLYYCNGIYDRIIMTGDHSMCIEHLGMNIVGLTDSYSYYYSYDRYNELKGVCTYSRGRIFADSYTETELEYFRYPDVKNEEDGLLVKQMKEEAMAELNGFIDTLLSECDLERADLFITK